MPTFKSLFAIALAASVGQALRMTESAHVAAPTKATTDAKAVSAEETNTLENGLVPGSGGNIKFALTPFGQEIKNDLKIGVDDAVEDLAKLNPQETADWAEPALIGMMVVAWLGGIVIAIYRFTEIQDEKAKLNIERKGILDKPQEDQQILNDKNQQLA